MVTLSLQSYSVEQLKEFLNYIKLFLVLQRDIVCLERSKVVLNIGINSSRLLISNSQHLKLIILFYIVIKWNHSLRQIFKLLYTTSGTADVYNNIVKLTKWSYDLKGCLFLLFIYYLSFPFLFIIRLKLLYFNQTIKQKGLYS